MTSREDRTTTRRALMMGAAAMAGSAGMAKPGAARIEIIEAPVNLGLRPLREGHVPGAWRAPAALRAAGFHARLAPQQVHVLERPPYEVGPQPGTRIRNGHTLRAVNLELAQRVA